MSDKAFYVARSDCLLDFSAEQKIQRPIGNILARAYRMSAINRLRLGTCSLQKME